MSTNRNQSLAELLEPGVTAAGMSLWGVEFISQGRQSILRVYIDSENGVTVDDCERVSHQLSGILDMADPIKGEYSLEVSSPGLDRPMFSFEQFAGYLDHSFKVRLHSAVNERRKFTAKLVAAVDNSLTFEVEGQTLTVSLSQVDKANLVPEFN